MTRDSDAPDAAGGRSSATCLEPRLPILPAPGRKRTRKSLAALRRQGLAEPQRALSLALEKTSHFRSIAEVSARPPEGIFVCSWGRSAWAVVIDLHPHRLTRSLRQNGCLRSYARLR